MGVLVQCITHIIYNISMLFVNYDTTNIKSSHNMYVYKQALCQNIPICTIFRV
jgi:hypothetical protein